MESQCTLLISMEKGVPPTPGEIQKELEKQDPESKIKALKTLILLILNGEKMSSGVLMSVIKYCINTENHELKKLLYLYWEVVEKHDEQSGKLLPQMILVCNALRGDLNHPNEYIRGCALRFVCKIKEAEIIEPLVASVKLNLEHRHVYVRRSAVMAVYTVWKNFGEDFFPDADEQIEKFLQTETDIGARRNAFLMLFQISPDKAAHYFSEHAAEVGKFGDGFQLVILELTRKICRNDPMQKSRFIKTVFQLLQSDSHAVSYEAAWTLVSLSAAPTAVRAAATAYTHLLTSDSDNNVKLIVLEKLAELKKHHSKVLQEILMDIMRALSSPNTDIRRKTLDITMDLVSPRNINEVVLLLKKEIVKTQSKDMDRAIANEYRQMLIKSIHSCAVKYPSIADSVVHVLMDFLNGPGALEVVLFVREIVESYPDLRESVLSKLMDCFPEIKAAHVYRVAVWILGEYAEDDATQTQAIDVIEECLGPLPFDKVGNKADASNTNDDATEMSGPSSVKPPKAQLTTKVTVLPDGTYATQTALSEVEPRNGGKDDDNENAGPVLRNLILEGDYLLATAVVLSLTKMILRSAKRHGRADPQVKELSVKLLMICCALIQAGKTALPNVRIDNDSHDRIVLCMRILLDESISNQVEHILLKECRTVFKDLLQKKKKDHDEAVKLADGKSKILSQPDDLITFRQLMPRHALGVSEIDMDDSAYLSKATGSDEQGGLSTATLLGNVHQLTGFSDPVYAEAQISVHDYDIILQILVINRTASTLSNLAIELATVGDLKIVERPQSFTIGAHEYKQFKANIKVSSTETGTIFGTITYDSSTSAATTVVNLNTIQIDIMDYIKPATCSDAQFRAMWAEFEWENKVAVYTQITNCKEFLDHIVASTNMNNLTPMFSLDEECQFLAANLYARSLFGEDALVNVSIEMVNGNVEGYIRIRAKTQGIALSLGDRITLKQKSKDTLPISNGESKPSKSISNGSGDDLEN